MIADYVIMLEKGQMLFAGSLEELKESQHPAIRRFLERQADTTACTPEDYFDIISASNDT
jgi:ABC-type transporter Mla maintaining outer membrane lipid asymmetry ATPase subunit MlaF